MDGCLLLQYYQAGRYDEAIQEYRELIESTTDDRVKSKYLSNCAQSRLQLRDYALAVEDATNAIQLDFNNLKAYIHRAVANEHLERFERALEDLNHVVGLISCNEMRSFVLKKRNQLRKNIRNDKEAAAKEVGQCGELVHEHQALRLNFSTPIKKSHDNSWYSVSFYIANEFGLFRKSDFPADDPIPVTVSAISTTGSQQNISLRVKDSPVLLQRNGKGSVEFQLVKTINTSIDVSIRIELPSSFRILGVVSTPIGTVDNELGIHCLRALPVSDGIQVFVAESPGQLGIGGKLWDSSFILAKYLSEHPEKVYQKRIVELGSGLGFMGLCCALFGAQSVVMTDLPQVIPLLQYNMDVNSRLHGLNSSMISVKAHEWGTPFESLRCDVVIMCDVVYDPDGYEPLLKSLELLDPSIEIIMGHRSRNPKEYLFFEAARKIYQIESLIHSSCIREKLNDIQLMSLRKHSGSSA